MNLEDNGSGGFALLCDETGRVVEIVRDDLGVTTRGPGCATLEDVFAGDVGVYCLLDAASARRAVFAWETDVATSDGRTVPIQVTACAVESGTLVLGTLASVGNAPVVEVLSRINNEQANSLRSALKESSLRDRERAETDGLFYEEFSRLNNELATAQRELAKKNAELAHLNEQKNRFLGMASHDLRNPLDVILTYSRFLLEDAASSLDAEQVEFLRLIESSSEFLLNLVDDLLDVSKIEAGRLHLELRPVDLGALVERAARLFRTLAERKSVDMRVRVDDQSTIVHADEMKVEQVLNNLVGNAIKFSPRGGAVEMTVRRDRSGAAAVSVTNSGRGVATDELERIFRPFEVGRARGTDGERSTGLGLAIAKRIVEGHGGRIVVESAPDRPTTFTFTLPLSEAFGTERT